MATAPITKDEILSRRRGRRQVHNAAEELPEEFRSKPAEVKADAADASGEADDLDQTSPAAPPPAAAPTVPDQDPPKPQVEYRTDPKTLEALQQAEAGRAALEQRLREQEARFAEVETKSKAFESRAAELDALNARFAETEAELAAARRREFETTIDRRIDEHVSKLTEDSDISPEAARTLAKRVLAPMITEMTEQFRQNETAITKGFDSRIAAVKGDFEGKLQELHKTNAVSARTAMNRVLLGKYPKFSEILAGQTFRQFGDTSPPFSLDSYQTLLTRAYDANDADRVLAVMAEFDKTAANRADQLAQSVDIETTPTAATQAVSSKAKEVTYSYDDIGDARRKMQSGEITRKQFQEFKAKFEKAEKEGRVQG